MERIIREVYERADNENKNESYLHYASNLTVVESLPREVWGRANMAIIDYGAGREIRNPIIQVDGRNVDLRIFFRHIFDSIDSEKRRYLNKQKVNAKKEELVRLLEGGNARSKEKDVERAIKVLKKLALEANKHDITNIDERINEVMPKGYVDLIMRQMDEATKFKIIQSYFEGVRTGNLLNEEEYQQLKTLIEIADKRRIEANKPKDNQVVRRNKQNG